MAKEFKDFIYRNKKLSDLDETYISVDFDQNPETIFAFAKDIEYGDIKRYRTEPNIGFSRFSDKLKFELHIVKAPESYDTQSDRILSEQDIRGIVRWLTSTDSSSFLEFKYEAGQENNVRFFYGQFHNIQSFNVNGDVYGLRLMFECSSPFGYSDIITHTVTATGDACKYTLINNDDRLNGYCYPSIHINSQVTGDVYFLNLSDCTIYEQGLLSPTGSGHTNAQLMTLLQDKISSYGLAHGYAPSYHLSEDGGTVKTIGNNTAVQFKYTAPDGSEYKCIACCLPATLQYYIIRGGFLSLTVNKALPVHINTEKLFIFDDLNRMVRFSDLGIEDVDYIYWPRLLNGENTFLLWGEDCKFTITYRETRKVGA